MNITDKAALVDNDFICHISESKLTPEEICNALKTIMEKLDKCAIMHTLVKQKELDISKLTLSQSQATIDLLFSQKIIAEATFDDIFDGDLDKQHYYKFLIEDFFLMMNPYDKMVLNKDENVLSYWKSGKNLGEIHSLATCLVCGCSIFLSDDNDSRKIAEYIKNKLMVKINVLNRTDFVDEGKSVLNRATRKSLLHSIHH